MGYTTSRGDGASMPTQGKTATPPLPADIAQELDTIYKECLAAEKNADVQPLLLEFDTESEAKTTLSQIKTYAKRSDKNYGLSHSKTIEKSSASGKWRFEARAQVKKAT